MLIQPSKAWIANCDDSAHYAAWIWDLPKISLHRFNVARSCEPRHLFKQCVRMILIYSNHSRPANFIHSNFKQKMNLTLQTLRHSDTPISDLPHTCAAASAVILGGATFTASAAVAASAAFTAAAACTAWEVCIAALAVALAASAAAASSALCSFTCISWPLSFLAIFHCYNLCTQQNTFCS